MVSEALITSLPHEVIEYMLERENVKMTDIINLALTCRHLYIIITGSNKLWRAKFFQRWPDLKEIYETTERTKPRVSNWLDEIKKSVMYRKRLQHQLSLMSAKYYRKQELSNSDLIEFDAPTNLKNEGYLLGCHFLIDELITLINCPTKRSNLTHKYYAYKVIRYLRQNCLREEWQAYINLPAKDQILERGAVLVAQWSQPELRISYSSISATLDRIAEQVKEYLREQNPSHPIFSTSKEQFELWKLANIDDNQWSGVNSRQVITALCEVMFKRLCFHGNSEMFYSSENSFINRVLEKKHGIPITLAIVFESIARRLGVRCEPVSFPAHFLLRWKEKYTLPESEEDESFYIDVFYDGQLLTKNSCPKISGTSRCPIQRYNIHNAATAIEVIGRMANNLEVAGRQRTQLNNRAARLRSALELLHLVQPYDTSTILHLARFYMLHQMDLAGLVNTLNTIQRDLEIGSRGQANHILQMLHDYERHMKDVPEEHILPKKRRPEVLYAIGLIMKHRTYDYLCVITGWDPHCAATTEWMTEMGVDELCGGSNQPFYNVFAEDGSSRYAAQENLMLACPPKWVNHYEIGRYFCRFNETHYVPNEEKAREYPEDEEIRVRIVEANYIQCCERVF
ncbi:F-box only protein 21-like isoform X2 [Neodiprion virginianus]|uniref:F-box only protein 21-like isoform X2 n=1 Tax=Neodiprion virginianus TaxID=2961670 RepID=UPI001EE6ABCD|nr:F-box only protein 21-like isoform X2 [Neodiprion virginianus]